MRLSEAVPQGAEYEPRFAGVALAGVTADSRAIRPDELFVALAGTRTDGARFVAAALAAGAGAVMAEQRPAGLGPEVPFVRVANARRALALTAARIFPRQPETIAAVTGTSGKTSVAAFVRQIFEQAGFAAAGVGTVGVVAPSGEIYGSLTTPDPVELHRTIDRLAREGVTHLAIEASSHGLDQHRLDGLDIAVAAYTNLSRDHLDYHPTLEDYFAAKLRLFTDLLRRDGSAVVNMDDAHGPVVADAVRSRGIRLIGVGRAGETIRVAALAADGFAQRLSLVCGGKTFDVALPLVGGFQAENALVAAGIAVAAGCEPAQVFASLERLQGAKGRLERVGAFRDAPIFVDYAHKPDALAKALDALRPYARGRLVVVFGCGGDRDQGKRPLMGAIAAEKADAVIVTDDNPRGEEPAAIRAAILSAAPGAREIGDRAEAIGAAIAGLAPGDVLLVDGKGHETGQIVGNRTLPFSDHEAVAAV
ncbi:MAG: UDP-N-acetylmuramoyl-L-alanyl-D-glutamate--2,6-diaminopimelate ligase, partial [Rhizobiales bacterium]|nr:UDP-N-acetylmuramoyl-L-alanyl-D-glutamate--2,6-diaminopimelate ligase [Hyphomicrobiales bacterium]